MRIFSMDAENRIAVLASDDGREETPEGTVRFQTEQQLASLTASWPTSRLVAIWNQLPGVQPVKRFTDRKTAVQRIWKALQGPEPAGEPQAHSGRQKAKLGKSRRRDSKTSRANTKTASVIALLESPSGASLKAIMSATGWQAHSVRGFISGQLGKRLGLRVKSFERDGERVYLIRR